MPLIKARTRAKQLVRHITRFDRETNETLYAYAHFLGLNESEANARDIAYRLATLPMSAVLRTRTLSEPRGFMKMLIDRGSDRILGFSVFGAEGSELMAVVQTAEAKSAESRVGATTYCEQDIEVRSF